MGYQENEIANAVADHVVGDAEPCAAQVMVARRQRRVSILCVIAAVAWFNAGAWAEQEGEANASSEVSQPSFHLRTGDPSAESSGLSSSMPMPDRSETLLREPPTIHGELQFGEQTLIPYVGAGFGGGYVTERDRMLGSDPTLQNKNILGDGSGKGYMPNEFHMGVRIPF